MTTTTVRTSSGEVSVTTSEVGDGRPFLILHGGAGPASVGAFSEQLAKGGDAHVIVPVHPGFAGTPRPESLTTVRGLAEVYARLADALGLEDVTVVGSSIGGWVTAELALLQNPRIARSVLVDAGGLVVPGVPVLDALNLPLGELMERSYRHPERFRIDPTKLSESQRAAIASNRATMKIYQGTELADPTLLGRLSAIRTPTLVVWGGADRIFPREHGEAYARAIRGARLVVIEEAGHLPPLETPELLVPLVRTFSGS